MYWRKPWNHLGTNSWSVGYDFNLGPPEYKGRCKITILDSPIFTSKSYEPPPHAFPNSVYKIKSHIVITVKLQESSNITSYCDQTFPSWSHDVTLRHWACFHAYKQSPVPPKVHHDPFHNLTKVMQTLYVSHRFKEFLYWANLRVQ